MKRIATLAALLAGCGSSVQVEFLPHDLPEVDTTLVVEVRSSGVARAALLLDGVPVGADVAVGVPLNVEVGGLPEGLHRIGARPAGVSGEAKTSELPFRVRRPTRNLSASPKEGDLVSLTPPVFTLSAANAWARSPDVTWSVVGEAASEPLERVDASTRRVALSRRLDEYTDGTFWIAVELRDGVGNRIAQMFTWRAPSLEVPITPFLLGRYSGRPTTTGILVSPGPPLVTLLGDGVPLGSGPAGGGSWTVTWDSTLLPDGFHGMSLAAPGFRTTPIDVIYFDNTPPVFVRCEVPAEQEQGLAIGTPISLVFSEGVTFSPAVEMHAGGMDLHPFTTTYPQQLACATVAAPAPSTLRLDLPAGAVHDHAGNPSLAASCEFPVRTWVTPAGAGPLQAGGVAIRADEVVMAGRAGILAYCEGPYASRPYYVPAAGEPGAGQVMGPAAALSTPGAIASGLQVRTQAGDLAAYVERASGGRAMARTWDAGHGPRTLVGVTGLDAHEVSVDLSPTSLGPPWTAAWTEDAGDGSRALLATDRWWETTTASLAPGATATDPHLHASQAAFVEETSTSPGLLRVVELGSGSPHVVGAPLNVDTAVKAASPSLATSASDEVLAWLEAGRVWVRRRPVGSAAPWGEAEPLDPTDLHAARSPRLWDAERDVPIRLVFVRETSEGDEIRFWELGAGAWSQSPYTIATSGAIRTLDFRSVDGASMVTWTDGEGHVFFRMLNGGFY